MPPTNINTAIGTGAIVVATIVAAAAVAIYESPEVRQFAGECRRKLAVALHSLGDEINPGSREAAEPRYNRPEDADGFMRSSAESGVEADEDSKRRQREELMYWNQVHLEKMEREEKKRRQEIVSEEQNESRGISFDDFLHEDASGEKGSMVYNSGMDTRARVGLVHRGVARGLETGSSFANPFDDEHHIDMDEQRMIEASFAPPARSEVSEDIYGADDLQRMRESTGTLLHVEPLVDTSEDVPSTLQSQHEPIWSEELYTSGLQAHPDAFAAIHAWADNNEQHNASSYPQMPPAPQAHVSDSSEASDLEHISGDLTPTGSASLAGSADDVGFASSIGEGQDEDGMSEEGETINTPGSWSEVSSVISGGEGGLQRA